ncbi:hypothetical protein KEG38_20530 [Polyangium jinanense]|uniref:hypothetical protein n=1 Tax=Polyangium jinanense TaxID=2829994 RepID=UPI002341D5AB|nr:hypothetical protein [Polyangium jinanense]MDC3956259.1 hypothetical protein [Polyangium jinanense]
MNGGETPSTAKNVDTDVCALVAERIHLVIRTRRAPRDLVTGKALSCDEPTRPAVCGTAWADEIGLLGIAFPQSGQGAFFFFDLNNEPVSKKRLTCNTIGLTANAWPEPGVERCATVKQGPLAEMTVIVDSRCDGLRMTVFDKAYSLKDPTAERVTDCDKPSAERLAGPELLCKRMNE